MKNKNIKKYSDIKVPEGKMLIVPNDNRLLEMPPYVNSSSPPPQWLKETPNNQSSIKRCASTVDYLSLGITIPSWTNFRYIFDHEKGWGVGIDQLSNVEEKEPFMIQPFSYEQTGSCPMTNVRDVKDSGYPKLVSPFKIVTAPGWSTLVLPVLFEPSPHYSVVPGIVNTDYYHELNCVLNLTGSKNFTIAWGTPLMTLIPIKRSSLQHSLEFLDSSIFELLHGRGFNFGALTPSSGESTARPYRAQRIAEDQKLKDMVHKKHWWNK